MLSHFSVLIHLLLLFQLGSSGYFPHRVGGGGGRVSFRCSMPSPALASPGTGPRSAPSESKQDTGRWARHTAPPLRRPSVRHRNRRCSRFVMNGGAGAGPYTIPSPAETRPCQRTPERSDKSLHAAYSDTDWDPVPTGTQRAPCEIKNKSTTAGNATFTVIHHVIRTPFLRPTEIKVKNY